MKTFLTFLLSCFCLVSFAQVNQSVTPLDLVKTSKADKAAFEKVSPFTNAAQKKNQVSELEQGVDDFDVLNVDFGQLSQFTYNAPEAMTLTVPAASKSTTLELELVKVDIFTSDFEVITASNGLPADVTHGAHYRGIIKGQKTSVVAVSILQDEIMGLIASDEGNLVIGKLKGDNWKGEHILYDDYNVLRSMELDCATPDDGIGYKPKDLHFEPDPDRAVGDCIRLYVEVDKDIHDDKGGVTGATNWITGLLNQVITLYANESITSVVSQIVVWDVTSPYSSTSSSGMLSDFQAATGSFNGDLAQLFSYQASGGIAAGFSGICNSNPDNSKSFSSLNSTYSTVPTYSWSVMVATHEWGHLWGSRHTHACVWNGNNTAIDGCAGSTEGSCSLPGYPSQGGTIMSYCHLQSVGINFNEGFGPQPGNVIRNSVANATCTSPCGPASCTDGIQNGNETGVDCGGPDCPACPTCSDGIQNGDETGVDCGGSSCPACPCTGENVTLTLITDNYPGETTWTITDGGVTYASGGPYGSTGTTYIEVACLNDGCYDFNIFDSYGDGICCAYGTGSYSLEDGSGNVLASGGAFGSSETTNFCISSGGGDTTPPSNPTNLSASNTTTTTTDLSWNASTDNVGVTGYNVYVDGGNIGTVTGTAANITGLSPSTTYAMQVTAVDAAGNESGGSNVVNVTTLSDGGGGCGAGVLSTNSFETGWEGWADGGSDCTRRNEPARSWDGSYSIRIRDNSGTASAMTSPSYDLSEFSTVDIEFYFYPNSMENGEDFWVRYNDGSGWSTVATYARGTSFENNSFYVATVTVPGGDANGQFRFQCDASANADRIYIDQVTITGNCAALPEVGGQITSTIKELKTPVHHAALDQITLQDPAEGDVMVYPNPAQNELNLNIPEEMNVRAVKVYSVNGSLLRHYSPQDNYDNIDITSLNGGIYFVAVETDEEVITKKFIKR
jgi:hypothetical protein